MLLVLDEIMLCKVFISEEEMKEWQELKSKIQEIKDTCVKDTRINNTSVNNTIIETKVHRVYKPRRHSDRGPYRIKPIKDIS
jgi:mRNA-degrading endonuclease RelE of RelBE toxin-antitoxin system